MVEFPERLNIADWLLDARVREGRGDRPALLTDTGAFTYREVQALANRFGQLLQSAGVQPEQRVIIALPDGPEFVANVSTTTRARRSRSCTATARPPFKPRAVLPRESS